MKRAIFFSTVLAFAFSTAAAADAPASKVDAASVTSMTSGWPKASKDAIKNTMEKYGPPHEATSTMLVWHNNGPWKRTIIYSKAVPHHFPMVHDDVMQQWIDFRVKPEKYDEMAQYDGSVVLERTNGEMSARCDKEGANFLAINLAHDVAHGKKSVADARRFYADAIKQMKAGKMPPYMEKFQFDIPSGETGFKDKPAM
ncbi:hypothetical protein [Massilia sp. H6]|uniref:hypothetical protein n=1 Tax=Massilia sp. H6 TaxID=2970464 RepID=UPI002169FDE1|nr:hypothetical protein [Massilia sp. H6]UVW28798.1 hypothetical protein NRS07_01200 [Massilia sp. H6]